MINITVCHQTCFSSNDGEILKMLHQLLNIKEFSDSKDKPFIFKNQWKVLYRINAPVEVSCKYKCSLMLRRAINDNVRRNWWAMLGRECTCKADEGPRCIAPHRGGASCLYCEADIVAGVMSCGQVNTVQINVCPLPDGAPAQGWRGAAGSNSPPLIYYYDIQEDYNGQ